jgi:hypothetical protein
MARTTIFTDTVVMYTTPYSTDSTRLANTYPVGPDGLCNLMLPYTIEDPNNEDYRCLNLDDYNFYLNDELLSDMYDGHFSETQETAALKNSTIEISQDSDDSGDLILFVNQPVGTNIKLEVEPKSAPVVDDKEFLNKRGLSHYDSKLKTYISNNLTNYYTKSETYTKTDVDTALSGKQATLVSGTNIKTINNQSLLGSGDISIQSGDTNVIETVKVNNTALPVSSKAVNIDLSSYATETWVQNYVASLDGNNIGY